MAMRLSESWFKTRDGAELFVRTWQPPEGVHAKAVVQIHHGLAEHGGRYERLAEELCGSGFVTVCHDARAHGKTAEKASPPGLGSFNYDVNACGELPLVDDMKELIAASQKTYAGLPLIVFGHSMGSIVAQLVTGTDVGAKCEGLVISGPPARMPGVAIFGLSKIVSLLVATQGVHGISSIPHKLTFEKFQKALIARAGVKEVTGFEWLSRDEDEVKKYVDDPLCGQQSSNGFYKALVPMVRALNSPGAAPRPGVPVLVIAGESDTCSFDDFGTPSHSHIQALFRTASRRAPPKVILYPNARHEVLNETNRDEVTRDVLQFCETCITAGPPRSRL